MNRPYDGGGNSNGPKGGLDPRSFLLLGLLDEGGKQERPWDVSGSPAEKCVTTIFWVLFVVCPLVLLWLVAGGLYTTVFHPWDPAPWWFNF